MKETIDYEKKYNETLERAREIYRDPKKALEKNVNLTNEGTIATIRVALLDLFKEGQLKWSEDERIRKELWEYFHDLQLTSDCDFSPSLTIDDVLAYLEKQKNLFESGRGLYYYDGEKTTYLGYITTEENPHYFAMGQQEKQKEQKPILEVFGFKVGDAVRLKDGDGRKHIIKSFKEVKGLNGPNFYHVEFEDNSARDGIYPGKQYLKGYYTQMEKFEEEQKPAEWSKEDEGMLQDILIHLEGEEWVRNHGELENLHKWQDWLKSLPERFNLQPKQEWIPVSSRRLILRKSFKNTGICISMIID